LEAIGRIVKRLFHCIDATFDIANAAMTLSNQTDVRRAAVSLKSGRLVGMPTETVYGLAADARNQEAVEAVFEAKGRPKGQPIIVHIGSVGELEEVGRDLSDEARKLALAFWPGPLTLVVKRSEMIGKIVTGGHDTVGVRMPSHPVALALLKTFGGPIAAPSANKYGAVSPTTAEHVTAGLGDRVDMVLDGGSCEGGIESTIVDVSGDVPVVLRLGLVTAKDLEKVLGVDIRYQEKNTTPSPGRVSSHYKPSADVFVVKRSQIDAKLQELRADGRQVGLVVCTAFEDLSGAHHTQVVGDGTHAYARKLYDCLHFADSKGVDAVIVEPPMDDGVGLAIMDRLRRASAPSA
jgi:L-threonylcarbamoyladenylate synthase